MMVVQRSFSRAARSYDQHAVVQQAMAAWLAEWLPTERRGRALEVGAGTGNFTRLVGNWPDGLVATDIASEMCVAGKIAVPGVEWRTMAAEQPLRGPWAWIFSSAMLQWMENPEQVFSAWREQLVSGGRILAALFSAGSLPEWRAVAGDVGPVRWRTRTEWRAILAGAGLQILRDEVQERTFRHPSAREFLRSLHGVGAAPQRRLTAVQLRGLLDAMERRWGGRDGVPETWAFYRFEAEWMSSSAEFLETR